MLLALTLLATLPFPADTDQWLTLDAGNFHVISNAAAAETERLARDLTSMASADVPVSVVIFRHAAAFAPMRDALLQQLAAPARGILFSTGDEHFILLEAAAGLDPLQKDILALMPRGRKFEISAPQPADRATALARLGHVLARARRETVEDAEGYLTEALRLNPDLPLAHAAMGRVHSARGSLAISKAFYEKAISLPSADANIFVRYGSDILDRVNETRSVDDVLRARKLFERALQLDPHSPRALAGLGATYVVSDDDPSPGIAALEKTLSINRGQEDAAVNLVRLYVRAGREADAKKLFESTLAHSSQPKIVRLGREALTRKQRMAEAKMNLEKQVLVVEDAMAKAGAGDYAGALKLIDTLLPSIADAEFRANVERLRADIVKKVK